MRGKDLFASLSLDLDNKWSYLKTRGDPRWKDLPSYLDVAVPRILELLGKHGLKITFFVVGQDAAIEGNHEAIRSIAEAGHEIGNHSFRHEPWVQPLTEEQFESDLALAEEHITRVTGCVPKGYRGPGYSLSETALRVLSRRGYLYDASTLPTFIGPLSRLYYFVTAKLSPEEKEQKAEIFGSLRDGLRPVRPYYWLVGNGASPAKLLEIPVTTMPVSRMPIHVSYLLFIGVYSPLLALTYFRLALRLCSLTNTWPSLLLHPTDFLGHDDVEDMSFFPAMQLSWQVKHDIVDRILGQFCSRFKVLPMAEFAHQVELFASSRLVEPRFGGG